MHDFKELRVWQRARRLASMAYRTTEAFPSDERYRRADQMRRAAASVGANLAEGAGRPSALDFARFVGMALGSLNELEHHSVLALDLGIIGPDEAEELAQEIATVRKMATGLRQYLLTK